MKSFLKINITDKVSDKRKWCGDISSLDVFEILQHSYNGIFGGKEK